IAPRPLTLSFSEVAAAGAAGGTASPLTVPNVVMTDRTASPAQDDSADGTADQSGGNQSGDKGKASSVPKGTKRRLVLPDWILGPSLFRDSDWSSYMRPPPKVPHAYVAFIDMKTVD